MKSEKSGEKNFLNLFEIFYVVHFFINSRRFKELTKWMCAFIHAFIFERIKATWRRYNIVPLG